ncbi:hypothetical protein [Actinoplanes sp. ATCC 53533]|uniref:hypothetical protein n=1 Tax=Actinoplanes sp. ATCC 53533 TaxID=1288362 RepID=UPI000F7B45DD|nr:hypothetical protein [Actinoplanes sp. ATCC 53533]
MRPTSSPDPFGAPRIDVVGQAAIAVGVAGPWTLAGRWAAHRLRQASVLVESGSASPVSGELGTGRR